MLQHQGQRGRPRAVPGAGLSHWCLTALGLGEGLPVEPPEHVWSQLIVRPVYLVLGFDGWVPGCRRDDHEVPVIWNPHPHPRTLLPGPIFS